MKPAPFTYHTPTNIDEAVSLLSEHGPDIRPLAGGQSLLPLMNLRLARPSAIVDLSGIGELQTMAVDDGVLKLGSMVRQKEVCVPSGPAGDVPLLPYAMRHVGHPAIRNRGTVGGSLAHADPSAEAAVAALALDAELSVQGPDGERTIPASDFFLGPFMTALAPGELLTEIRLPTAAAGDGWGFEEVARIHGDFALVSVAAVVHSEGGTIRSSRIVVSGAGDRPLRVEEAESSLEGESLNDDAAVSRAAEIVRDSVDPASDVHATADYRRRVAGTLTERALRGATGRAQGQK